MTNKVLTNEQLNSSIAFWTNIFNNAKDDASRKTAEAMVKAYENMLKPIDQSQAILDEVLYYKLATKKQLKAFFNANHYAIEYRVRPYYSKPNVKMIVVNAIDAYDRVCGEPLIIALDVPNSDVQARLNEYRKGNQ